MTTIVRHKRTGNEYILLSITGETNKANPSRFLSELFEREKSEVSCSATICDVKGNLFLAYIDELVVTEIDGKKPADVLGSEGQGNDESAEYYSPEPIEPVVDNVYDDGDLDDFESDELLEEEFDRDENEDDDMSDRPKTSFVYGQGSPAQRNPSDDDDEDWI